MGLRQAGGDGRRLGEVIAGMTNLVEQSLVPCW